MKRIDRMMEDLQKLNAKRSALDTQILGIQALLIAEIKSKLASAPAEKPPTKKPEEKKPAAKKPVEKKPAKK